jgi:ABC-2 type transport system permease protein
MKSHRIIALLWKFWFLTTRRLDRIFDITYWPLINLVIFGFTALYIKGSAEMPHIVIFLIGGALIWILLQRAQQDAVVYLLEDFWNGNLSNTFITPITTGEMFTALCITGLLRAMFCFALMTVVSIFAYNFFIFSGGLLPFVFMIPLFIFAWAMGFAIAGLIFRYGTQIQIFAWSVNFLFQPLSGVYYPIITLPPVLQKIAFFVPSAHVFEGFRQAYSGSFNLNLFILAMVMSFIYFALSYLYLVSSVKKARKTGMLTKY